MQGGTATAGRKRAAIELIAREDPELRRTARRYSLCDEDAEDAYQRSLEILLVKAPSERPRELVPWMKTVVKHEALAVRANRERLLGLGEESGDDPVARLVAAADGPGESAERRERVALSREALQALKPAERRSLTLLAAGYSYDEISASTGYSRRKVNRCVAEGRARFRSLLSAGESGGRCAELAPLLSLYCDREAGGADAAAVREHLRACPSCRATMRAYRATPAAVAALAPLLPVSRSLLERAQELAIGLQARLPGGGGDGGATQVAASGGARGAGIAALAKGLAICAGTVGGAAACVATGIAPAPLGIAPDAATRPAQVERVAERVIEAATVPAVVYEDAPAAAEPERQPRERQPQAEPAPSEPAPEAPPAEVGAVEYAPPPAEAAPAPPAESTASAGGAAGEFGP